MQRGDARGFYRYGGPEVLTVIPDVPCVPYESDVVIRVDHCGVNPVDASFRIGRMSSYVGDLAAGFIPGMECSGVVVESGLADLQKGKRVAALALPGPHPHAGAYAQYVCVSGNRTAVIPDGLSSAAAAAIPLNGATATSIVKNLEPLEHTVVITGAAGALGRFLVVACRVAGLRTIALARESDQDLLLDLGAHQVIVSGESPRDKAVKSPHVLIDAANLGSSLTPTFQGAGKIVRVRADSQYTIPHDKVMTANVREATRVDECIEWWTRQVENTPAIIGPIDHFTPSDAYKAHERLTQPGRRGRITLAWREKGTHSVI